MTGNHPRAKKIRKDVKSATKGKNLPRGYCSVCPWSSYGENDPPYQLPRGVFSGGGSKFDGIGTRTGCGGVWK